MSAGVVHLGIARTPTKRTEVAPWNYPSLFGKDPVRFPP